MKKGLLTVLVAVLAVTASAQAGIMVNFTDSVQDDADTNTPGQQVGGITGTTWNTYNDSSGGELTGLVDDLGGSTAVSVDLGKESGGATETISWTASGFNPHDLGGHFGAGMNGDDGDIYDTNAQSAHFVDDGDASWVAIAARISGLDAGTYDFYVVGRNTYNDGAGDGFDQYDILAGTVADTSADTAYADLASVNNITNGPEGPPYPGAANVSTWVDGQNYAKVTLDVAAGEDAVIVLEPTTDGEARGFINTLQIVPEPATMSLLAIGGLGALIRRRRK